MKYYHIESLGCAKNLVDSEVFAYILESAGYKPGTDDDDADLVLVNSCAFLQSALAEFDMVLSDYAQRKNDGEIGILIVSGCVMNRALEDFQDLFPEVDAWIGLKDFEALKSFLGGKADSGTHRRPIEGGHYAYLRISDGCQNRCSYCAIPSIRGDLISVPMEALVKEAQELAQRGAKELILIAQDSSLYGLDLYGKKALDELIETLLELKLFHWIRLLYLHPDNFELKWLDLFSKHKDLLPYFEIPIQHSEDSILKAMNRKKSREELKDLFGSILERIPHAILRTTLISGFPGESPANHKALMDFVADVPFMHLGVFCYSAEPGTPAFEMKPQVSEKTAMKRQDELLALHRGLLEERLGALVGTQVEALVEAEVEEEDETDSGMKTYICRAWFHAPDIDGVLYAQAKKASPGSFVTVEIDDLIDVDLFGRIVLENK